MFNEIESRFTRDRQLKKQYDKHFYRDILLSFFIAIAVGVFSYQHTLHTDGKLERLISICFIEAVLFVLRSNSTELVDFKEDPKTASLQLSYYNFWNKIKTEEFHESDIERIRKPKWRRYLLVELSDNRQIKLICPKSFDLRLTGPLNKKASTSSF